MGNVRIVQEVFLTRPTVQNMEEAQLILTNPCDSFMSEIGQIRSRIPAVIYPEPPPPQGGL